MDQKEKLEAALRKAKIEWRRIVDSPKSTPSERRRALSDWKKAGADLDLALVLLRRTLADRRRAIVDRRKASAESGWAKEHADRRKMKRRP
jgi:hypothetical protein